MSGVQVGSAPRRGIDDRLGSTLFLAALVHGVIILGVTFTVASIDDDRPLPSLNVTLLVDGDRDEATPEDADYIANRNSRGAGRAAEGLRPTTTLSSTQPLTQLGDPQGADLTDGTPREATPSAEQLVTRASSDDRVQAQPQPTDDPAAQRQKAAALIDQAAPQTAAAELDLRAELPNGGAGDAAPIAAPSARESALADYLAGWRRRVERVGTANYPAQFLGDTSLGRPTLEVVIAADGRLEDIVVRKSSGDKQLDQAALKILRLAAPFEPLPEALRENYDVLRFAYEWDFFAAKRTARAPTPATAATSN
ncbi:MAG TPA: TonB family protein [Gammaproteobacteria bacterium]|nr:TonB family protein [Gammaproteobacteria bacterium]